MPAASPVSQQTVNGMAGAVQHWLYAPGEGFALDLPERRQAEIADTHMEVLAGASEAQLRAVGGVPSRDLLLGLFTTPPPHLMIFADAIAALGEDPIDVFDHELGHRFQFDHALYPATAAILSTDGGTPQCSGPHHDWPTVTAPEPGAAALAPAPLAGDGCAVCRLHALLAEADALLRFLREQAWLAAQPTQIPLGLGGTIPLAQRRAGEARVALATLTTMAEFADRAEELAKLDGLLQKLMVATSGQLDTEATSHASELAERAWRIAARLNQLYWLRVRHPGVSIPEESIL